MASVVRSYQEIIDHVKKLQDHPRLRGSEIGIIHTGDRKYPLYKIEPKITQDQETPFRIFLSAGIHGNEPGGVWAVLEFLRRYASLPSFYHNMQFTILPCLNPYGYEFNTRENAEGFDLNRQFRTSHPPMEVRLVKEVVRGWAYNLVMEFHEDVDTPGFYLYELTQNGEPSWGKKIIERVALRFPINMNEEIEETSAHAGLILRQDGNIHFSQIIQNRTDWPQAFYHFTNGTRHYFATETPVFLSRKERVEIHLMALDTALKNLWEKQNHPNP